MDSFMQKLAAAFAAVALAAVLVACGGGGGSADSSEAQGKGTVGILLTDKPADPALFEAIIASIIKVELMGSEENGRVELYSGPAKKFDLLRLRNESIPLAFKDDVPTGTYCKIRLILDELTLVLTDDTPDDLSNNPTDNPKLPGNGKLDLVVRNCFDVVDGEVSALQLDMDAGKSFHIIEKGNCSSNPNKGCFNFRPVVFVDVIDKDFASKLVRLYGTIKEVYSDSLLLCDALPNQNMDNEGCVKVHFSKNSAFFDNIDNGGAPTSISDELLQENNVGKNLIVVGWVKSWPGKDNDDNKPKAYYPVLYLEALVAELGNFLQKVEGVVVNAGDTEFDMTISAGQMISPGPLQVILQAGEPSINGTRIVSKSGMLLTPADVKVSLPVQVDGIPQSNLYELEATLVIVDTDAPDTQQITGVLRSVANDTLELAPDVDTVCGVATNPLVVDLTSDVEILTVTITDVSSEITPGGTLQADQTVGMGGSCELTGYQTDNVVIVDDQQE